MLMPSKKPLRNNIVSESHIDLDNAKTIMLSPNPVTTKRRFRPALPFGGYAAAISVTINAPTDGAAFNKPNPDAPVFRISLA